MSFVVLPCLRPRAARAGRPGGLQLESLEDRCVPANVGSATQNFVDQVYRDVLHRGADPTGLAGWSQRLDSGQLSREAVVLNILGSEEGLRTQVNDLYLRFLHRPADETGLRSWSDFLRDEHSNRELAAKLIGSGEYFQNRGGGTREGFLNAVFQDVLCRPIGQGELADRLDDGDDLNDPDDREDVARDILESDEGEAAQVRGDYVSYLRRTADPTGLSEWSDRLDDGDFNGDDDVPGSIDENDDLRLVAALLSSPEYNQRAQTATTTDFATIPGCGDDGGIAVPGVTTTGTGTTGTGTTGTGTTGTGTTGTTTGTGTTGNSMIP